jgi:hypothetical protein
MVIERAIGRPTAAPPHAGLRVHPPTTRRRRGSALRFLVPFLLGFVPVTSPAHEIAPQPVRELVRIQGYRAPAPQGIQIAREVTFNVLGRQIPFTATEWRSFAFHDPKAKPTPAEPTLIRLQGERHLLHRITSARTEQRVTILADRRPGSADVFVLTVDLCPSE